MISLDMNTINGRKYTIYLPDTQDKEYKVKFKFNEQNLEISLNEILIVLKDDMTEKEILEIIKQIKEELQKRGYKIENKITFTVDNELELSKVNNIINMGFSDIVNISYGINYYISSFKSYLETKTISKINNGKITNYVIVNSNKEHEEFLLTSIDAQTMANTYFELLKDDKYKDNLQGKTKEEISDIILNYIAIRDNLKKYYLNGKEDVYTNTNQGKVMMDIAQKDDKVNTDIGIVKSDIKEQDNNEYKTINTNGEEVTISKVNPGTISIEDSSQEINVSNYNITKTSQYEDQLSNFYLDEEGNLYDKDGEFICNINTSEEYKVNPEDNSVYKDDIKVGFLDDYKSLKKEPTKENVKRKVLIKENNNGIIKISIMGILLGISIMTIIYLIIR